MKKNTCCFTGHRPQSLPWKYNEYGSQFDAFKHELEYKIINSINKGYTHFISGMAMGLDLIAAEIILSLKNKYQFITLECAIPCKNQTFKWSPSYKQRYNNILEKADKVIMITDTYYTSGCMEKRNKYMVDNSNKIIALYLNTPGGTKQTLDYAKNQNIEIELINLI